MPYDPCRLKLTSGTTQMASMKQVTTVGPLSHEANIRYIISSSIKASK